MSPGATVSSTLTKWRRLILVVMLLLAVEMVIAGIIRGRLVAQVLDGSHPFEFVEVVSVLGFLTFPVMLYAMVRLRGAHRDLDAVLASERESAEAVRVLLDTTTEGIEDRKRMEAELRQSEARTRLFLRDLPLGVFIVDEAGHPVFSNALSIELLGLDADPDIEGDELPEAYQIYVAGTDQPYDPDRIPVIRALRGETLTVDDIEVHRPDGSVLPLEVWAGPIRDSDGTIRYAAAAFSEISARKEAEEALNAARHEAERASRAKSEFLSRMSHELRTPLNAILGFAQLLEMDERVPEQRDSIEQIIKGGRRLLELINEVLDISRIESGRLSLSMEPVAVCDVAEECVRLVQPLAEETSIRVRSECADKAQFVWADRHRLGQVLINLLSNAIKYNVTGGSVTVTSVSRDGRIRIGVTDTGPGISPQDVPRLFTPFERLEAHGSTVEGTGLGLALVKNLVEAMGGGVVVDTIQGRGTTLWMDLQATDQLQMTPVEKPVEEGSPERANGERRILYIEDNPANLTLIERLLERRMEFEILSAVTGSDGLTLARDHVPDLILLDIGLPDIRGDEVLARLRRDPNTAHIPVVILSADATPGEIERLMAAGALDYLTKPIDVPVFMRVLDSVFSGHDETYDVDEMETS